MLTAMPATIFPRMMNKSDLPYFRFIIAATQEAVQQPVSGRGIAVKTNRPIYLVISIFLRFFSSSGRSPISPLSALALAFASSSSDFFLKCLSSHEANFPNSFVFLSQFISGIKIISRMGASKLVPTHRRAERVK